MQGELLKPLLSALRGSSTEGKVSAVGGLVALTANEVVRAQLRSARGLDALIEVLLNGGSNKLVEGVCQASQLPSGCFDSCVMRNSERLVSTRACHFGSSVCILSEYECRAFGCMHPDYVIIVILGGRVWKRKRAWKGMLGLDWSFFHQAWGDSR